MMMDIFQTENILSVLTTFYPFEVEVNAGKIKHPILSCYESVFACNT